MGPPGTLSTGGSTSMKRLVIAGIALALLALAGPASAQESRLNIRKVVKGNTEFAFDLYDKLAEGDQNLFFSPSSISTGMAATHAGAGGETAKEMAKTMRFTLPPERLHAGFAKLLAEVNGDPKDRKYELTTANALWIQQGFPIKNDYQKLIKDNYGAGVQQVDFADGAKSSKTINDWVEKETKNTIKDLIKPDMVNANTRFILTNAIYFKGNWEREFKKDQTKKEKF